MCCLARLDYFLPLLSLLTLAYFFYRETSAELFSKEIEQLITRLGIDILLLTGFWIFLVTTEKQIFLKLMPLAFLPHAWLLIRKKKKKIIQPDEDSWICKNCGTENHNVLVVCHSCGKQKQENTQPSLPGDTA